MLTTTSIITKNLEDNLNSNRERRFWPLILIPHAPSAAFLSILIHLISEFAIFFGQFSVSYLVCCISERFADVSRQVDSTFVDFGNPESEDAKITLPGLTPLESDVGKEEGLRIWENMTPAVPGIPIAVLDPKNLSDELQPRDRSNLLKISCQKILRLIHISELVNDAMKEIIFVSVCGSVLFTVAFFYVGIVLSVSSYSELEPQDHLSNKLTDVLSLSIVLSLILLRLFSLTNIGEKLQSSVS
jgi:hypothetical protein